MAREAGKRRYTEQQGTCAQVENRILVGQQLTPLQSRKTPVCGSCSLGDFLGSCAPQLRRNGAIIAVQAESG
jgi:hypothetical protein